MAVDRTDFILNEDGDFPIQDTVIGGVYLPTPYGLSDNQHKEDLIIYDLGWLSQTPLVGFGANNYLNSEYNLQKVERSLRIVFIRDGYNIRSGIVSPNQQGGFNINPSEYSDRI